MHRRFEKEQDRVYEHVKARGECDSFSVTHVRLPTFTAAPLFELSSYVRAVSLLQGQEFSELAMLPRKQMFTQGLLHTSGNAGIIPIYYKVLNDGFQLLDGGLHTCPSSRQKTSG